MRVAHLAVLLPLPGVVAHLLRRGRPPGGLVASLIAGLAGWLVVAAAFPLLPDGREFAGLRPEGLIGATVVAVLLLIAAGRITRRRRRRDRLFA